MLNGIWDECLFSLTKMFFAKTYENTEMFLPETYENTEMLL